MIARLATCVIASVALVACAGDEEAALPEFTSSPSATPAPATPPDMTATDHWFRGIVSEMNTACYVDAICSVTVEVTESLGGASLEEGTKVVIIESYGFSTRRCNGQWTETPPGSAVEVLAHAADGDSLAVCESDRYFVKDLQAPE